MKQVIFLCLLSISLCVSKPANEAASSPQQSPATELKAANSTIIPVPVPLLENASETATQKTEKTESIPQNAQAATEKSNETKKPQETKEAVKPSETKAAEAKPTETKPAETKPTETKPAETKPTETKPAETKPTETKPAEAKPTETKPAEAKPTEGAAKTTEKEVPKTSEKVPKADDATVPAHPVVTHPGFDGASFVGGIILTLGLLALGFMGYKYYKNQSERNYHTL